MTQKEALDILKLGNNVYLTGSAGSGKTYLLNAYIKYLKEHDVDVAVTASTGIAASHMNGVTIHSWSGLGIRSVLSDWDLEAMEEKKYLWERFQKTKVLIIDEISMLHHYRLDLVERVARFFKRNNEPFGGLQVILCGDFFQLPPVSRPGEQESRFAYHSDAWKNLKLKMCYLTESHRQNDQKFLAVLNAIRSNSMTGEILNHLMARHNKDPELPIMPTKLYTHNADVDGINNEHLGKTEGSSYTYKMTDHGNPALVAALKNSCLAPETLSVKKGAQVMFVKNNYEAGYVNGTLGTVIGCNDDSVKVETVQGKIIYATRADWTIEEDGKIKAQISQIPLRLAWAITIHKSQGMTLDAAEIDLAKAFEKGMGYVALSRVRSLDGLKLVGINDRALEVSEEILMFDEDLQEDSQKSQKYLEEMGSEEKEKKQEDFIRSIAPLAKAKKEKKTATHIQTKALVLQKVPFAEIMKARELKQETIVDHIEKLVEKGDIKGKDIEYMKDKLFTHERLEEIEHAFRESYKKHKDYRLTPIKILLGNNFSFTEIRLARLFIKK